MTDRPVLGIDIGGSGIKGAPVDLTAGEFAKKRLRIDTPRPSTPDNVAAVVEQIVDHFAKTIGDGPIGITIPSVVTHGQTRSAANIDKEWIDAPAAMIFEKRLGRPITLVNDADAAGIAEMTFGAGAGRMGVVVMLTLGTGIGCAVFNDGVLLPNTELGHLEMNGHDAEHQAAARIRDEHELSWKKWAQRVDQYLDMLDHLLWPDLIIIGGGVSRKAEKFFPYLDTRAELVPAALQNEAGIVGAALAVA